jgi:hypothetical protein
MCSIKSSDNCSYVLEVDCGMQTRIMQSRIAQLPDFVTKATEIQSHNDMEFHDELKVLYKG